MSQRGLGIENGFATFKLLNLKHCYNSVFIFAYVPPIGFPSRSSHFNMLEDCLLSLNRPIHNNLLIFGDFNVRLGTRGEFDELELNIPPRNSQETCAASPECEIQLLLKFIRSNGLTILNGRHLDPSGPCTHFGPSGGSVIDYALASLTSLEKLSLFKIGPHLPHLSDHCMLSCILSYHSKVETPKIEYSHLDK